MTSDTTLVYLHHSSTDRTSFDVGRSPLDHGILCLTGCTFGPHQNRHRRLTFANVDLPAINELVQRPDKLGAHA